MSFREEDSQYVKLRDDWLALVSQAYVEGCGTRQDQVDNLMLASYRFSKHINNYLRHGVEQSISLVRVPRLPLALKRARVIVEQKDGLPSLFNEADALEALSRACFRWLKDNDKLKKLNNV